MDDRLRPLAHDRLRCVRSLLAGTHLWAAALLALGGCSYFDLSKNIPWGSGADGEFAHPMKVISVWQDTVLHQDGAPPVRGFGGRVWFYGPGEQKPICVEGMLEVYAYDETDRAAENTVPDRKYVFSAEDVEKHHSEGKLGHSYSFWLPWGDVNGPPVEISLICRFTPSDGGATIVGEETQHLLPGRELPQPKKPKPQAGQETVRRARAYEAGAYQRAAAHQQRLEQISARQANGQPHGVAHAGYTEPTAADATQPQAPVVQTPLGPATRMRVTTLKVPVQPGGVTPFTTMQPAQPAPAQRVGQAPATAPAAAPPQPLATGYPPGPRRVLGGPIERLTREHDPRRPNPARWQSGRSFAPQ